jgi:hypothetical protein
MGAIKHSYSSFGSSPSIAALAGSHSLRNCNNSFEYFLYFLTSSFFIHTGIIPKLNQLFSDIILLMKKLIVGNKKIPKKLLKAILMTLGITALTLLWSIFREALFIKPVTVYGTKSLEGAQVYVNNSRAGTMIWDEKENLSYAQEERWSYLPSKILNQTDHLLLQLGHGNVEIKIITKENKTYKETFTNYDELQNNEYFEVNTFTQQ